MPFKTKTAVPLFKLFCIALCIVAFTACKKSNHDITPTVPAKKLQQISWAAGYGSTVTYTYDASGKLSKAEDMYSMITYQYGTGTVQVRELRKSDNKYVNDITGTLDASGRMTSATNTTTNSVFVQQWSFIYDANGYLKKFTSTDPSQTQVYDFTITNGDYTQMLYSSGNTVFTTENTTFYTDKKSLGGIDKFPVGFIFNDGLFGKTNTHLINQDKALDGNTPTVLWNKIYSYTVDGNGYVQAVTLSGTWTSSATYTFQ